MQIKSELKKINVFMDDTQPLQTSHITMPTLQSIYNYYLTSFYIKHHPNELGIHLAQLIDYVFSHTDVSNDTIVYFLGNIQDPNLNLHQFIELMPQYNNHNMVQLIKQKYYVVRPLKKLCYYVLCGACSLILYSLIQ